MNPRFLDLAEVLEIHQSRIDLYGGTHGIRDIGLLQSALAQPLAGFGEQYFHADIFEMAAAYLFHLSQNHAFVDGNKRTALACSLVFLAYNGTEIETESDALEELTVGAAQGHIDKKQIAEFFRQHGIDSTTSKYYLMLRVGDGLDIDQLPVTVHLGGIGKALVQTDEKNIPILENNGWEVKEQLSGSFVCLSGIDDCVEILANGELRKISRSEVSKKRALSKVIGCRYAKIIILSK